MHNTDNFPIDPSSDTSSETSFQGVVQTRGAKRLYKELVKQIPQEVILERLRLYSVSQNTLVEIDWWLRNIDRIMGNTSVEFEQRLERWGNGS